MTCIGPQFLSGFKAPQSGGGVKGGSNYPGIVKLDGGYSIGSVKNPKTGTCYTAP